VWDGDNGTTAVSGATTRRGVEFETRYDSRPGLAADLDLTYTHSQFSKDSENGGGLALAPKTTWAGGLSARHALGRGVARAGLRFFGIGDRPATDDGALVAPGFHRVDLHLGYRRRWFDVAFDVENCLDQTFSLGAIRNHSRLPNEPAVGTQIPTASLAAAAAPGPESVWWSGQRIFYGCPGCRLHARLSLTLQESVEKSGDELPESKRIGGRVVDILAAVEDSRWPDHQTIRGQAPAAAAREAGRDLRATAGSLGRRLVVAIAPSETSGRESSPRRRQHRTSAAVAEVQIHLGESGRNQGAVVGGRPIADAEEAQAGAGHARPSAWRADKPPAQVVFGAKAIRRRSRCLC